MFKKHYSLTQVTLTLLVALLILGTPTASLAGEEANGPSLKATDRGNGPTGSNDSASGPAPDLTVKTKSDDSAKTDDEVDEPPPDPIASDDGPWKFLRGMSITKLLFW